MAGPATATENHSRCRVRPRLVLYGAVAGLLLATGVEAGRVLLGDNFHTLIPGRVYRCAQLSGPALRRVIQAHGIRTVINLRGCGAPFPWYRDECRATHDLNVAQEDVCFSAGRLPPVHELRRLVGVLDRCEYPVLLHCRRGADRTGLAAAIVLLLQRDVGLDEGRRQLGLRYGHVALGRPAYLDRFLDLYTDWLRAKARAHSRADFRRWLEREYCPGELRCALTPVGFPSRLPRGRPFPLGVRVRNTGVSAWRLQPETNAGIHLRYVLWDASDQQVASARAGLFHAVVHAGQTIDLTLALPALKKAGRYRLLVDMVDEQQCWFFQAGSEPLETEMETGE
jgi:protein tyrosine phosphatase (PTP) superfamily phosphohydrolase (DUF442 family)